MHHSHQNDQEEMEEKIKYKKRYFQWENTNLMLNQHGYCGLKTGITEAAGPCLSACYQHGSHSYIVILLGCVSMEQRWAEVPQLIEWAKERKNFINKTLTTHKKEIKLYKSASNGSIETRSQSQGVLSRKPTKNERSLNLAAILKQQLHNQRLIS